MESSTPTLSGTPDPTINEVAASTGKNTTPASSISNARKYFLLCLLCVAQFIDVSNISCLFAAVPTISRDLHMTASQASWLVTAYQLTFAAFLLFGGRMSDIYNPKWLFVVGFGFVGILSLVSGFVNNTIGLIVMRAVVGLFAAMSIPSALSIIIHLFPEPQAQAGAIAVFSATGAIGNVLGLIIGAIFVQYTTWHWIFWFAAIVATPTTILSILLIPMHAQSSELANMSHKEKLKRLDAIGVGILTAAVILFIYGVTSGPVNGWSSVNFLAPFIISIPLVVAFFVYERIIPEWRAAIPPRVWFYPNFGVWFGLALFPYTWFTGVFLLLTNFWQGTFHWSPIITAVHFLPFGITAFIVIFLIVGPLQKYFGDRTIAIIECSLVAIGSILLAFADRRDRYWSFVFPGFVIGVAGNAISYAHVNISIFKTAPPAQAGVVGAILQSALQLGSAVGTAVVTAIESGLDKGTGSYKGRAAGFWWLLALALTEGLAFLVFYRNMAPPSDSRGASTADVTMPKPLEGEAQQMPMSMEQEREKRSQEGQV